MELNNCQKRNVLRTAATMYVLFEKLKDHREKYEEERKRCEKEKEYCKFDSYSLGRLTFCRNEVDKMTQKVKEIFKDIDFGGENKKEINIVIDKMYLELNKYLFKKDKIAKAYKEELASTSLPKYFVDSWLSALVAFKFLKNKYTKTLVDYGFDINPLEKAINQYEKYFLKEILVIGEC